MQEGGELWKPISEFKLWDETYDDEIEIFKEVATEDVFFEVKDEIEEELDENNQVVDVTLGIQAVNEQKPSVKTL